MQNVNSQQPTAEFFSLLPKSEIDSIKLELQEIKNLIHESNQESIKNQWLPKSEARKRLHVCLKTLDSYLSRGIIPFSKFAGKIYIKASDIEKHLQKHYIKAS